MLRQIGQSNHTVYVARDSRGDVRGRLFWRHSPAVDMMILLQRFACKEFVHAQNKIAAREQVGNGGRNLRGYLLLLSQSFFPPHSVFKPLMIGASRNRICRYLVQVGQCTSKNKWLNCRLLQLYAIIPLTSFGRISFFRARTEYVSMYFSAHGDSY